MKVFIRSLLTNWKIDRVTSANLNCEIMRKILVAVFCLFLLGACSQKNEEEQTDIFESGLELAVRSGESVIPVNIPASVYDLSDMGSDESGTPSYFAQGEKISFKELISGKYTFFVLGNHTEGQYCSVYLRDRDKKVLDLYWENYIVPELFGGIVEVDGSNESETVEMTRLVGGIEVNVTNKSEFTALQINFHYMERDTIHLNDYAVVPQWGSGSLDEGELVYRFPTRTPVKGEIIAYDDFKNEYYFDFESTKCIERNKKLTLNITLERVSPGARSWTGGNTVTCVENVSEL